MQQFEIPGFGGAPEHRFNEQAMDQLRPAFMQNVVSPLAHTTVVGTVDRFRDRYLESLHGHEGDEVRRLASHMQAYKHGDDHYRPERHADLGLIFLAQQLGFMQKHLNTHPAWDILTPRQQATTKRFTSFANSDRYPI